MTHLVRLVVSLGLAAASALAFAQAARPPEPRQRAATRTLTVTVPQPGEYILRILPSPESGAREALPTTFGDKKTTVTLDPAVLGKKPRIAVDDVRTGNTALVLVPPGDTLELRTADFRFVRRLDVKVTHQDRPVKTAQVVLTPSEGGARTQNIGPTDAGTAMFEDVPAGPAKIVVGYGDNLSVTHDAPIHTDHPAGVLQVDVPVGTAVPTVDAPDVPAAPAGAAPGTPARPGTSAAPAPPAEPSVSPIAAILNSVLGLALVGGAVYLLYRWAQSGGMAATLKKAGIEVSGPPPGSDAGTPWQPNAPQAPVVTTPGACQFCGQVKDASGRCACALDTGTGVAPAAGVAGGGAPRLVGTVGAYSGATFPIDPAAPVSVGRDATNGIALPNDTTVSRRHATLRADAGVLTVSDEGSSNGVYVNGVRIAGAQALRPGDEVQIGSTRFRFEA